MKAEEFSLAVKLLFENFWIIRADQPEDYNFLRRHQQFLQKEFRQRFGMNVIIRPQYIQLLKRPFELSSWMGDNGFTTTMDFALFCCGMAYVEELEADTPFMMDDLVGNLQLNVPEELAVDWNNYNHRKSLVRAVQKMEKLRLIEKIEGEVAAFEQSEENVEILFVTTVMARNFLARAPKSYSQYENFADFKKDLDQSRESLERNQLVYQKLLMSPQIQRTAENEDFFVLMRNYYRYTQEYIESHTDFHFELYRDYAAFTLEQRDNWQALFPSRQVVDEILIQLATLVRQDEIEPTAYGEVSFTKEQWEKLLQDLRKQYLSYWSKEFSQMSFSQLSQTLLRRGISWGLLRKEEDKIIVEPAFGRLVAEMRLEDDK